MVINWSMLVQMVDQLDNHMVGLGSTCLTILVKLRRAGKPSWTNNNQLLKTNVPLYATMPFCSGCWTCLHAITEISTIIPKGIYRKKKKTGRQRGQNEHHVPVLAPGSHCPNPLSCISASCEPCLWPTSIRISSFDWSIGGTAVLCQAQ